jgi:hypothetical protein
VTICDGTAKTSTEAPGDPFVNVGPRRRQRGAYPMTSTCTSVASVMDTANSRVMSAALLPDGDANAAHRQSHLLVAIPQATFNKGFQAATVFKQESFIKVGVASSSLVSRSGRI